MTALSSRFAPLAKAIAWTAISATYGLGYSQSASQTTPEPQVKLSATIEQHFINSRFVGQLKTRDRFTRAQVQAETGNWTAKATYWYYPFPGFYDWDETTLQYSRSFTGGSESLKAGRFLPPIGQTNWDDQWYSGFLALPQTQFAQYGKARILFRTVNGVQYDRFSGDTLLQVSQYASDPRYGTLDLRNLDRTSVRLQQSLGQTIVAATGMFDQGDWGKNERLFAFDVRHTLPHWIFKAEFLNYRSQTDQANGYYVSASHRPAGWNDVTLVTRMDHLNQGGARTNLWTLGASVRLPQDWLFVANYMAGPSMNNAIVGGGWQLGINRIFRF